LVNFKNARYDIRPNPRRESTRLLQTGKQL